MNDSTSIWLRRDLITCCRDPTCQDEKFSYTVSTTVAVILITDNYRQQAVNYRQQAVNYRQQAHNYRQQADNYRQQAEKYRQQANTYFDCILIQWYR